MAARLNFRTFAAVGILAVGLVSLWLVITSSPPPDPAAVEALISGLWLSRVDDDFLYEFTFEDGVLGGRLHHVRGERHYMDLPVDSVSLDGTSIEIGMGKFPSYHGEVDFEAGRIEGGIPEAPRFRSMNLTRVESAGYPMTRLRPPPAPGEPVYVWTRPESLPGDWPTATPSEVGIDPAAVQATVEAILAGEAGALHSFLVLRDGKLVVEEYFHGWGREDLHRLASVTKSVASLLVGLAIDQGHLSGVDVPLLGYFPEYASHAGRGWETIRLKHLLTMTLGLDWSQGMTGWLPPGKDPYANALHCDVVSEPGTRWSYVSGGMDLLSQVLLKSTGVEADVFAAEHLFAPLGISRWDWEDRRWNGHPNMIGTLRLRPRDLAKLGQLVLDEGRWQGRRVVSAEWIRESTRTHIREATVDPAYAYLWWRMDPPPPEFPLGEVTYATGSGSQFIVVVPDARLVVVSTGGNDHTGDDPRVLWLTGRHLAPGVQMGT